MPYDQSMSKSNNTEQYIPGARSSRKRKKGGIFYNIALLSCIAIFAVSSFLFAQELIPQILAINEMRGIREFKVESSEGESRNLDPKTPTRELPNFEALSAINEDVVGWMYLDGASIDHPIVQGKDNEYYLSHTFKKIANSSGSIFIDYHNSKNFTDQNVIIYGHKMKNGTMFAKLLEYRNQNTYEKSPIVSIYKADGKVYHYQIFASEALDENYDYRLPYYGSDFSDFIERIRSKSKINSSAVVGKDDRILTLSTCTPSSMLENGRFVVFAVLLNKDGNDIELTNIVP